MRCAHSSKKRRHPNLLLAPSAMSAVPAVGPSGAMITASETTGTTCSNVTGTAAAASAGSTSRRRRTKKVAKRKRRPDGEDDDESGGVTGWNADGEGNGHEDGDSKDSATDYDDDGEKSVSEGSSTGSPTSFVRRRRQRQMQMQQQWRRSSSDFITLDTTTTSEDDDDDDDGGEKGAGDSSSEYHDSEDGDLDSSDDDSDQNADGAVMPTRRSTRNEGSSGARADSADPSRASSMVRPSPGDSSAANPFSVSFDDPGGGRRTKKMRSAKRLVTVSMPRTGQALKGQAILLTGSVAMAFNGTNADTSSGNGASKRKRGRPKKNFDSSGMNIDSSNTAKKTQPATEPASLPISDPPTPKGIVGPVQQPTSVHTSLVFPTGIEETVSKAASLVAAEIKSGCWVRRWADGLSIVDTADHVDMDRVEKLRDVALHTAAAALEQFAMQMILPSFISAGVKEGPGGGTDSDSSSGGSHRTLSGTFLALREILILNADSYFFHVGLSDKDRPDTSPENDHNSVHGVEEKVLRSRLLATGVLFASVNRLDEERERVLADLVSAIGEYDAAEDSFALYLERADGRSLGVLPNGHALGAEENIAWGVSFNAAREKHPLITTKKRRDLARRLASYSSSISDEHKTKLANSVLNDTMHTLDMPKPNACALYFVGEDGMMMPGSRSPR